ncbi:hypothetical protein [Agromyces sp. LHK192]|uniref:hypothetical protein n=1 Tax=Agromyces sp. LHK192 TaxID=2498704 RepID=UPI0013E32AF7|nr:hypothetical protein [Agromyces sp. LHK192]
MSDPLNPWEEEDRLAPTGDLSEDAEATEPDDLDADNPVEEDTIETVDPENAPA